MCQQQQYLFLNSKKEAFQKFKTKLSELPILFFNTLPICNVNKISVFFYTFFYFTYIAL